jgi:hypothetical protein
LPVRLVLKFYLKQGDALSSLLFTFALEYAIKKAQESQLELKLIGARQLQVCADDVLSAGR